MRFLLDANVCIDYLNGTFPDVARRIHEANPSDLSISVIALAELRYGADKSAKTPQNHRRLDTLIEELRSLDFDESAAAAYGRLRSSLEAGGTPVGPNDMLIAAQAISADLVLVTANEREFSRIEGLRIENWRLPAEET